MEDYVGACCNISSMASSPSARHSRRAYGAYAARSLPARRRTRARLLCVVPLALMCALSAQRHGRLPAPAVLAVSAPLPCAGAERWLLCGAERRLLQRIARHRPGEPVGPLLRVGSSGAAPRLARSRARGRLSTRPAAAADQPAGWRGHIEVLYDGFCRVCLANKALLESWDNGRGVLHFVNIAAEDYDASAHAGVEFSDAMNELHIILPAGEVLRGTEAVLHAYDAVGLAWAVRVLGSPGIRWLTDRVYRFISEHREGLSKLSGGSALTFREKLRGARFLQKGVAEGEGCGQADGDDEDCIIAEEEFSE